ncbi:hypothetical protein U2150_02015 [Methanothermobacter wolfeii]|uniref:Energy-converting hydrogenase A subunit B n=1 Tax=Methanothermobacter wolfeii TaxID=145261 RepID=A0ABU8TT86_METWO|nr:MULTISPECIES: hypothetical protein [Methanothermobacter]MDI6701644.1 hypothetical protein [Methanothermobacter wolfeii]MDI6842450.1 hypothetical protein [Methanothermobacter wolfeii]NLM02164.1 hypothetical protein [Methanothermobacter wolfeii]QHN06260.1 hypothetical protein FZP57_03700 [Methanothermobacter sp. THM-1]SCM56912.1 putative protein MJ0527 [Methanothermobacter wolfeii]
MNELIGVAVAAVISWLNFVIIDTWMGLPEKPGVRGADYIGRDIKERGGDLAGGFFQGNIVCSPDASAGTLLGAVGCYLMGVPEGGLVAALLVYIGNRLCADPGYAGTTGALSITLIIGLASLAGLRPEMFVAGMVIAITSIQGINHGLSSRLLGAIARKMGRYTSLR